MSDAYINKTGLAYFFGRLKSYFVPQEIGKGLSTNDFSTAEQMKLASIESGATVNKLETIKINGSPQSITDRSCNILVPTNTNQLTNGSGFQTSSQVQTAIASALSGISGVEFEVVASLPSTGQPATIYLLSNSGTAPNIYDEYIYVSSKWEKIGSTDVDLTGYWAKDDLMAITTAEIDAITV